MFFKDNRHEKFTFYSGGNRVFVPWLINVILANFAIYILHNTLLV